MIWWLLLFASTALVATLPMLPAILEWWRRDDIVSLHIDALDDLDPTFMARSFAIRLGTARAVGQTRLGRSSIAEARPHAAWPLDAAERRSASTLRVWHVSCDAELPANVNFLAELAGQGSVTTAADGVYRALWVGQQLKLAPRSTVLRWAHAAQVDVGADCRLAGKVSADQCITIAAATSFTLLHAPAVRFGATRPGAVAAASTTQNVVRLGLPDGVAWDAVTARGTSAASLKVGAQRAWRGDLVCRADLHLGAGCNVHGSLKAHGELEVAAGGVIAGNLVAVGRIALAQGCVVRGSIVSEIAISLGEDCVIGAPDQPATVTAPSITVAPGVVVHGTLWASRGGLAQAGVTARVSTGLPVAAGLDIPLCEATA